MYEKQLNNGTTSWKRLLPLLTDQWQQTTVFYYTTVAYFARAGTVPPGQRETVLRNWFCQPLNSSLDNQDIPQTVVEVYNLVCC